MPVIHRDALRFNQLSGRASADPLPGGLASGCSVRVVRIQPGARTPHRHPHTAEVVYVAQGRGVAWEDGTTAPVSAGDVIAVPRGVPHATAAVDAELLLVCFFPTEDLPGNLDELDGPTVTA